MGIRLPHIFARLTLAVVALASHAAVPVYQLYWNSVLPNTQMPKAISQLLQPEYFINEDKSTSVEAGEGKSRPGGTNVNIVGKDGMKPVYLGVTQVASPFFYRYVQSTHAQNELQKDPNVAVFFLEKDMHLGTTMTSLFTKNTNTATFLPRETAGSIPFSSNKLPEIFKQFSVKPATMEANIIKQTIEECETPAIGAEEKYCATSIESMIEFTTSKFGIRSVQALSTEVEEGSTMSMQQKYTIMGGVKQLAGDKVLVCHKQNYPNAVFYCHEAKPTRAYVVPLKGADGVKVKAVAICHIDTSEWNPEHLAFQVLKVKPGKVPICHFLPNHDHIVWVPTQKFTSLLEPVSST